MQAPTVAKSPKCFQESQEVTGMYSRMKLVSCCMTAADLFLFC